MLLYRTLLREHKNRLPAAMRGMGNAYLKNEFELHKTAKPEHLEKFYSGWEEYLHTLRQQGSQFGKDLDTSGLSAEQVGKLSELRQEAKRLADEK
jgi:hypothetical protein